MAHRDHPDSGEGLELPARVYANPLERESPHSSPRLLSGKATAAAMLACLTLAVIVALTLTRRLPLWIRFEVALTLWWLVWIGVLTRVLYTAASVQDDHALDRFRWWFSKRPSDAGQDPRTLRGGLASATRHGPTAGVALGAIAAAGALSPARRKTPARTTDPFGRFGWLGAIADGLSVGEGFGVVLLVIAALAVLALSLWLLVEILIPTLAFAAYALLRTMLTSAARLGSRCRGHAASALGWALILGTLYVAPLAAAVWLGHVLRASSPG